MNKEDRNTFLLVALILVVCIVSLVAIFNILWRVISDPISTAIDKFSSATVIVQGAKTADYNFAVPELTQEETQISDEGPVELTYRDVMNALLNQLEARNISDTATNDEDLKSKAQEDSFQTHQDIQIHEPDNPTSVTAINYDYNFSVPKYVAADIDIALAQSLTDAIVEDAALAGYGQGNAATQVNLQIRIPKIAVNSPVVQGLGADDLLEQGFWVHPGSYELGEGEIIMLCHRRFFGPYDPRSCWFLDTLTKGDEILVDLYDLTLEYRVVGVNVFDGEDPLIYTFSPNRDYIKIVTCTPLYSNEQRLVVLAKRVK